MTLLLLPCCRVTVLWNDYSQTVDHIDHLGRYQSPNHQYLLSGTYRLVMWVCHAPPYDPRNNYNDCCGVIRRKIYFKLDTTACCPKIVEEASAIKPVPGNRANVALNVDRGPNPDFPGTRACTATDTKFT